MKKKYDRRPIDSRMLEKRWYKSLPFEYRCFVHYLIFKVDDIGLWKIDMQDFIDWSNGFFDLTDVKMDTILKLCNQDKQRILLVDSEARLFLSPTILFRNCNTRGNCRMVANFFYPQLLEQLAQWQECRDWFCEEVFGNEGRLTVDRALLDRMIYKGVDSNTREFVAQIARAIGYNMDTNKPSVVQELKAQYGHQCQYCGGIFSEHDLTIDEIKPQSQGGKKVKYNQVPACTDCNRKKGTKNVFLFMDEQGFEWLPGLENKVNALVKKKQIAYPSVYPIKRKKKKEKYYTFKQVEAMHHDSRNKLTQSDFEITDRLDETTGLKLWRIKQ